MRTQAEREIRGWVSKQAMITHVQSQKGRLPGMGGGDGKCALLLNAEAEEDAGSQHNFFPAVSRKPPAMSDIDYAKFKVTIDNVSAANEYRTWGSSTMPTLVSKALRFKSNNRLTWLLLGVAMVFTGSSRIAC
ncbi:hypothetical protein NPX13_g2416 [Xylaria arbuscula]|uniref:Uncharacterized protein n=1 Tax=Xylaria arbuscula TaxID=114810 RepID=A0A9W8NK44_9PEZI|nr:hypothetical protein NPX13_g2416 [Xylaria arbuscula]